jgi:hypothetical protein
MLTASLEFEATKRLGMEEVSKVYEDTTMAEAFTDFTTKALIDVAVAVDGDVDMIVVEPIR